MRYDNGVARAQSAVEEDIRPADIGDNFDLLLDFFQELLIFFGKSRTIIDQITQRFKTLPIIKRVPQQPAWGCYLRSALRQAIRSRQVAAAKISRPS